MSYLGVQLLNVFYPDNLYLDTDTIWIKTDKGERAFRGVLWARQLDNLVTMKSELDYKEFKRRLTELTSKEKELYLFAAYNPSGPRFCGTFDDSTFDLTRNSFWRHVKSIEIKGKYRQVDNGFTDVDYTIGLSKFTRIFSMIFFCLVFVCMNTFLIVFVDKI